MSFRARALAAFSCLLVAAGVGLGLDTAPATASSTLLCTGYTGCANLGMSNSGYAAANSVMYWKMYAGHNCTNYAAYRMVESGLPNVRPWTGSGNASNWGIAMADITDSTPTVGSVAWWGANVNPAGAAGHVAYVEQVVSPTEIIVSQDSWGGDFAWTELTLTGGSWPSGFIHFNDVRLTNTVAPTVSGTPKVGSTLTATSGTFKPVPTTIAYQWQANGRNIVGATSPTLALALAQQGQTIVIRTKASRTGYPNTLAYSVPTTTVQPGVITDSTPPTITGTAQVASTLKATPGTWTPAPTALAYQWTADGSAIAGATSPTLTASPALVGKSLAVSVTASKPGYANVSSASATTPTVAPAMFTVAAAPTISGTPQPGQTLTFNPGRFAPSGGQLAVQWLRAGVPVVGSTGPTYQLGSADLGSRITARWTLTEAGYTTINGRAPATWVIKVAPRLALVTKPGKGRVLLKATLTATGVTPVTGTVQVWSRGKLLKTVTLVKGTATTTLTGLAKGSRAIRVRYVGSTTVLAAQVSRTVQIG